jgi:hypothetical protein
MEKFNFEAPADVYNVFGGMGKRRAMTYVRFDTGALAVQHVIEVLGPDKLKGSTIETDESQISADEIRAIYDSVDYPLPRGKAKPS